MRKLMVTIVAFCLGLLLPVAAMPVRVCQLDPAARSKDCCPDCAAKKKDCCVQTDGLPNSSVPAAALEVPFSAGYPLPPSILVVPTRREGHAPAARFVQPRTGVGPPGECRAVLNVWRL